MNTNIIQLGGILCNVTIVIAGILVLDYIARHCNLGGNRKLLLKLAVIVVVIMMTVATGIKVIAYGNFGQPRQLNTNAAYILVGKVQLDQKYTVVILCNEQGVSRPILFLNAAIKDCENGWKCKVEYGAGLRDYFLYSMPK